MVGTSLRPVQEEGSGAAGTSSTGSSPAKRVTEIGSPQGHKRVTEIGGEQSATFPLLPGMERVNRNTKAALGPGSQSLGGFGKPHLLSQTDRPSLAQNERTILAGSQRTSAFGATVPKPKSRSTMTTEVFSRQQRISEVSALSARSTQKRTTDFNAPRQRGTILEQHQNPLEQMEPSVAAAEAIMINDRVMLGNLLRNQHISTTTLIGDHALIAWAAEQCRPEMCRVLLESSADVEAPDAAGRTALALGAGAGDVQVCELLLDHQARVQAKDNQGHGPLHWAAYGGSDEACALLLTSKASLSEVDATGQTPLHTAARFGHSEVCELLLRQKAEANAVDQYGQAPLHLATLWGFPHICALLLESGADRNLQRKDGAAATHLSKLPWI